MQSLLILAVVLSVGVATGRTVGGARAASLVIREVRVFDGEHVLERATVVVRDGVITEVGLKPDAAEEAVRLKPDTAIVDGAGMTLLPGLIDSHMHVAGENPLACSKACPVPPTGRRRPSRMPTPSRRCERCTGVPILAGTDAPNPGTAHGSSMHRELELLVAAGLSPVDALRAATSLPARHFRLPDRGRIAPGLRADLLLVRGDPTTGVAATREIVSVWRSG